MRTLSPVSLALIVALLLRAGPAPAADIAGQRLDDTVEVAGKTLKFNGGGIGQQLLFKVYAIGLYLPEPKRTREDVAAVTGPRRVAIWLLRDVGAETFGHAVLQALNGDTVAQRDPHTTAQMVRVCDSLSNQSAGLRKGDVVTLDWVPGTGTVVALNNRPVLEPQRDPALYTALLDVWLGDKPVSHSLKARLLGQSPDLRASVE